MQKKSAHIYNKTHQRKAEDGINKLKDITESIILLIVLHTHTNLLTVILVVKKQVH